MGWVRADLTPPELPEQLDWEPLRLALLRRGLGVMLVLAALLGLLFLGLGQPTRLEALAVPSLGALWLLLHRWPASRRAVAWSLGLGGLALFWHALATGTPASVAVLAVLPTLGLFMDGFTLGALLLGGSAFLFAGFFEAAATVPAKEAVAVRAGVGAALAVAGAGWLLGLRKVQRLLEEARAALRTEAAQRDRLMRALYQEVVAGQRDLERALAPDRAPDWAEARRLLGLEAQRTHGLRDLRNRFVDPDLAAPLGADFSVPVLRSLLGVLLPLSLAGFYYHVVLGQGPRLVTPLLILLCVGGLAILRGRAQAPAALAWLVVAAGPLAVAHDLWRDWGLLMTPTLAAWSATIFNAGLLLGWRPALAMAGLSLLSTLASALVLPSSPVLWHRTAGLLAADGLVILVCLQSVIWQKAVLGRLEQERSRLAQGLVLRRRLLGTLFHDIANPFAALGMICELEQNGAAGPDDLERSRRLLGRVRELLQESRLWLEEGAEAQAQAPQSVGVDSLLAGVNDLFKERLRSKGIQLQQDVPPGLHVRAQAAALRDSVLSNLLSNAIKFSPPGARLELAAQREGDRTCIELRDRGPGLSPELRRRLRGGSELPSLVGTAGEEGQGLGLGLALEHVRRMGGELVFLDREGGGLVARVCLDAA